jgi:hypothetical protein
VVADPFLGLGLGQCLGQQFLGLEDLHPAVAHRLGEHVVLGFGAGHPQHIVEQQFLCVGRRQRGVLQAGPVNHHAAQLAHFRVHSERHCGLLMRCPAL